MIIVRKIDYITEIPDLNGKFGVETLAFDEE
jgi:hypothetical protein